MGGGCSFWAGGPKFGRACLRFFLRLLLGASLLNDPYKWGSHAGKPQCAGHFSEVTASIRTPPDLNLLLKVDME